MDTRNYMSPRKYISLLIHCGTPIWNNNTSFIVFYLGVCSECDLLLSGTPKCQSFFMHLREMRQYYMAHTIAVSYTAQWGFAPCLMTTVLHIRIIVVTLCTRNWCCAIQSRTRIQYTAHKTRDSEVVFCSFIFAFWSSYFSVVRIISCFGTGPTRQWSTFRKVMIINRDFRWNSLLSPWANRDTSDAMISLMTSLS